MDMALKKREELAAVKHLRTLIQPCPSYEGYILAVFPREWQKSDPCPLHHFWQGKKQLSLQFILTVLVFQFLDFFFYLNDTFSPQLRL